VSGGISGQQQNHLCFSFLPCSKTWNQNPREICLRSAKDQMKLVLGNLENCFDLAAIKELDHLKKLDL
jgi:hypothetical protein